MVAAGLERVIHGFPRLWHVIPQPLTWSHDFPDQLADVIASLRR